MSIKNRLAELGNFDKDPMRPQWRQLDEDEQSIVDDLDNLGVSLSASETDFISDAIIKLQNEGWDDAEFSEKQIEWLHSMEDKYL